MDIHVFLLKTEYFQSFLLQKQWRKLLETNNYKPSKTIISSILFILQWFKGYSCESDKNQNFISFYYFIYFQLLVYMTQNPPHQPHRRFNMLGKTRGMVVLYLCAQVAVLYTYNCLLILIYYRLGQNQLNINKQAVRSWYSLWPIQLVKDQRTSSINTLQPRCLRMKLIVRTAVFSLENRIIF